MRYLKMILLFLVITTTSSTAFTQTTSTDSTICFNSDQLKKIAKDLKRVMLQDSIIQTQAMEIENYKQLSVKSEQVIHLTEKRLSETDQKLNLANKKLKVSGMIVKFGIPGALIAGYLIGKT